MLVMIWSKGQQSSFKEVQITQLLQTFEIFELAQML